MCYVQMSLFGLAGYVIIGNTFIPSKDYDIWYTPTYFLNGFWYRTQKDTEITSATAEADTAVSIETGMPVEKTALPDKVILPDMDIVLREAENGQLEFAL